MNESHSSDQRGHTPGSRKGNDMGKKVWLLAAIVAGITMLTMVSVAVSANGSKALKKDRLIYMSAVEWKGSRNLSKEAYPTAEQP